MQTENITTYMKTVMENRLDNMETVEQICEQMWDAVIDTHHVLLPYSRCHNKKMKKTIKKTAKRINSKAKGNRGELELAKIFSERFKMPFARVGVSSGARTKNTKLPDNAAETMTGDIICPPGFRFSIECKSYNKTIDFFEQSKLLDQWLNQTLSDAATVKKIPMLCIKRPQKGWIALIPAIVFPTRVMTESNVFAYYAIYGGHYLVCELNTLLKIERTTKGFWFETD